jgi:ribonucleoside-diphosphate reductase alpha chain
MKLSENSYKVGSARYFLENETWEQCCQRVGKEISKYEEERDKWENTFAETIYDLDFIPGGRILRNAASNRCNLFNCYVLPISDSAEGIMEAVHFTGLLWMYGGGVGINFSPLRPQGAVIRTRGGYSSGPISFIGVVDSLAKPIESGGQRRAAGMAILSARHPDINKFLDAKLKDGIFPHFNISVSISEDFIDAVEEDKPWQLMFEGKTYETIKARDLWNRLMANMVRSAEPGLIHWENLRENNSYYFSPIISTNPCGEVPRGEYECCNLGSINLANHLSGSYLNRKKLEQTVSTAVRFLDNVIDVNHYIVGQIEKNAKAARRIGIGTMGLADYLMAKEIRYGSQRSLDEIQKVYSYIRDVAYLASTDLAHEKGTFPKYDRLLYNKARFVRSLGANLRLDIKRKGIRNCTLLAQAPTGTISLLPEVCAGIEPLFAKAYRAKDNVGERYYVHKTVQNALGKGQSLPDYVVDSYDITPIESLAVQATVQKYMDGAVSKTINLPSSTTPKDLSEILLESIRDLKGVTVYVDKSKGDQPLTRISMKEAKKHLKDMDKGVAVQECKEGTCDL